MKGYTDLTHIVSMSTLGRFVISGLLGVGNIVDSCINIHRPRLSSLALRKITIDGIQTISIRNTSYDGSPNLVFIALQLGGSLPCEHCTCQLSKYTTYRSLLLTCSIIVLYIRHSHKKRRIAGILCMGG